MTRLGACLRALAVSAVVAAASTSCDERVDADEALDASLRVTGARFVRAALPPAEDGPRVQSVSVSPIVPAGGVASRRCSGVVEPAATAVALTVLGDPGYWIVRATIPDVTAPGFPTFETEIAFASSMTPGRRTFVARAVDEAGRFGPPVTKPLDVAAVAPPAGRLVVSLTWGNQADLDLHVVDPSGVEIWKRNPSSAAPPPAGAPPDPVASGGVLDFDSNAACVADGRRAENVVWKDAPPRGRYLVRVDTFSLCRAPAARWRVEAFLDGASRGAAEGVATEVDERFTHDRGAGVLALEIDVP